MLETAASRLSLETLPPEILLSTLGALITPDEPGCLTSPHRFLASAACVSRTLRAAAADPRLPQWSRVRTIGPPPPPFHLPTFVEYCAKPWFTHQPPHPRATQRRVRKYEAASRRYVNAQVGMGTHSEAFFCALLARCASVHTLNLDKATFFVGRSLLQRICTAWGSSLRILHLGNALLSSSDLHAILAACPRLVSLSACNIRLLQRDDAVPLFSLAFSPAGRPHAGLRRISLPLVPAADLSACVARACARFPGLLELNASAWTWACAGCSPPHDGGENLRDVITNVASFALDTGLQRFLCAPWFHGMLPDSSGDSDYEEGHYVGDGDMRPVFGF